jgi:4-carboxymuconolactone decarboxylase
MMRLSLIAPAELTNEQKPLYDEMKAGVAAKYSGFTTMRKDGAILGLGAPGYTIPISVTLSGVRQME